MSVITSISIQKNNKNRCNVFVDGDFFMSLPIELVYSYSLKTGTEINETKIKELALEKDKSDALNMSISYINRYSKTKKQLKEYLIKKGYSDNVIRYCVAKLTEYGLINDTSFAKQYIENNSVNSGKRLLSYKLMMKGIAKEEIDTVFENSDIDYNEKAKELAEKRLKGKEINRQMLSKTFKYLISKGFSYDEANYAISEYKEMENE